MDWPTLVAGIIYAGLGLTAIAGATGIIEIGANLNTILLGIHATAHAILRGIEPRQKNGNR